VASRAAAQRGGEVAVPVGVQDAGGEVKAEVDDPADCGAWRRNSRPAGPSHGGRVHATSMDPQLMPIGRFRTSVPVEREAAAALRRAGPAAASVGDPGSGYRYYRAEQARAALSIGWLRSLDVPLAAIGQVLAGRARRGQGLAGGRPGSATTHARHPKPVLTEGLPRAQDPRGRPPRGGHHRRRDRRGDWTGDQRLCGATWPGAGGSRPRPRGPLIGLFPLDLTDQATVRVAAEVDQDVAGTAGEVLGGRRFAVATHLGPTTSSRLPPTPCWPGSASTGTRSAVACARSTSPIRSTQLRSSW
jgi:DNA-binding transcriptional MerR regulator